MGWVMVLAIIGSTIWVLVDAQKLNAGKHGLPGIAGSSAAAWFVGCILLWIVFFPLYLTQRPKLEAANRGSYGAAPPGMQGGAPQAPYSVTYSTAPPQAYGAPPPPSYAAPPPPSYATQPQAPLPAPPPPAAPPPPPVPAGWLADPTGRHEHRYWDGSAWTSHVADAGQSATDPL